MSISSPFGASVEEILLSASPLVNVIAQVRFPAVMRIETDRSFVSAFQESIRHDYPILRGERQLGVMIGPSGVAPQDAGTVWRFEGKDPDSWQITLASSFVSLSTNRYTSRSDLLQRFAVLIHAVEAWLDPKVCDRIGVRYVDRVSGDNLLRLDRLVRPEVLGLSGKTNEDEAVTVVHSLSDTLFQLDDHSQLRGRWGTVPKKGTYDPGIQPADVKSWVLDLDHSTSSPIDFDLADISERVATFCDRIYRFFRWAVTEEFLNEYGAQI